MAAHTLDAGIQPGGRIQHHRHQIWCEFDVNFIKIQQISQRAVGGRRLGLQRLRAVNGAAGPAPGRISQPGRGTDEGQKRQARHQRKQQQQPGHRGKRRRIMPQLAKERYVNCALRPATRQQQGCRDRDDDSRDLANQTVTHSQYGIGFKCLRQWHSMDGHAHHKAHDDVQQGDKQPRHSIALHEFRCAIQRSKEVGFRKFHLAPGLGLGMGDGTCRHIGINRQLPPRHPSRAKRAPTSAMR